MRGEEVKADEQLERVRETIEWAESRIRQCRRDEAKHGSGSVSIEASFERRTLQAVLRMLTGREAAP